MSRTPAERVNLSPMVLALGVDVSVVRGLDTVLLDERRRLLATNRNQRPSDLGPLIAAHRPEVVCIDSPPAFGRTGRSRLAERELLRLGIHSYATPSEDTDRPFYDWMRVGHECFAEAEDAGFPLYRSGETVLGHAIEVFPHASAVILAGRLPAARRSRSVTKRAWREAVLLRNDVPTHSLRSLDQIDAALGALTGLLALEGSFTAIGDPNEGVIVLPSRTIPARFDREGAPAKTSRVQIVEYTERWPGEFEAIAASLGDALGPLALHIDHIGSTAVPGLAAKNVVDVQVTVVTFDGLGGALARTGLRLRSDIVRDHRPPGASGPDSDWEKRYADVPDPERPVHVHFRVAGRPNQRYALLFRDYLRTHPDAAAAYERAKRKFATLCPDSATYADAKDPICDAIIVGAETWAEATHWSVPRL